VPRLVLPSLFWAERGAAGALARPPATAGVVVGATVAAEAGVPLVVGKDGAGADMIVEEIESES
jgi:hypothetical protein